MKLLLRLFVSLFVVITASLLTITQVNAAPPANFQTTQIIGSGLDGPTGFEIAPDGRIFILQRTGEIKIYKNGQLLPQNFAVLPSIASGDRGLIGIAFDPEFHINKYVYFYYTGLDKINRLVRFNASGDVGTDGPYILYETKFPSEWLHVGGSIRFAADGTLFFAVGDNGNPNNAQDLSNPHGKILRINKDGSIPTDNPFYGTPGALPEIWAYGLRNPWRFQFDSVTGRLYGGDVGDYTWEEVNYLQRGRNYGWPTAEGLCTSVCPFMNPIHAYPHNGQSAAVTGGPIYRGQMFPQEYQGRLFFGDYAVGFIRTIQLDENGNNAGVIDFDNQAGSVVDMKVAPDGSMYYITFYPGRLYRITYSTSNRVPTANATANETKGVEPMTVQFSSAGSSDPDGSSLTYSWNFGDGTTSNQANPTKVYTQKGTFTVELTVSDGTYTAQAVPIVIQVGLPPAVTIAVPNEGDTYQAGDTINYQAFATDGAGFDMNDAAIKTTIVLHHDTHIHPFLGPLTGRAGNFTLPDVGESSANTWYRISVTATDANGLSTTESVNIYPRKTNMTFQTQPAGLQVLIDGIPVTTPRVIEGVENFKRELNAPVLQQLNGIVYQFAGWDHNASQRHTITTPVADATYTARFTQATPFTGQYFNNTTLSGTPVFTRQDTLVNFDWGEGSPDPRLPVNGYSVRWTNTLNFAAGTYNFRTITDDGVRLYIDDNLVIDEWHDQGSDPHTATVNLTAGQHTIRMEYYENAGGAVANLTWDLAAGQNPPPPPPSDDFTAQYFNNMTLAGQPALTRNEEVINHDWGMGSPDGTIAVNNFSARWTKTETLAAGMYTFTATADDGVRVIVDGETIINEWKDQPATTYTATKTLAAGDHTIVMEYYENGGGALARLQYALNANPNPNPTPTDTYTGQYWNVAGLGAAPVFPATAPTFTRPDTEINFNWDQGSPSQAITPDDFLARWTKQHVFEAGVYTFTLRADDGIRLIIDGQTVLDEWKDQPATTYTVDHTMTAGTHTIVVEYYENGGGAVAQMNFVKSNNPNPTPTQNYTARFWNILNWTANPEIPATAPTLTREDAEIDFDWGGSSPAPAVNPNQFVAQWTKTHTFTAGTYRFTTVSDDGIRVFVDDQIIIDQWNDHAATTHTADRTLTAGNHTIRVEFYENGGGALARFDFEQVDGSTPPPPFTGWNAEFFNNITLTGTPILTRQYPVIDFNWSMGSPDPVVPVNNFSARFTRQQQFSAGTYTFTTRSDDGVRLFIDDNPVINNWTDHAMTEDTATVTLTEGVHTLRLEYYENGGGAVLQFEQN
jgi:glucose/arabinose dehydrogenase